MNEKERIGKKKKAGTRLEEGMEKNHKQLKKPQIIKERKEKKGLKSSRKDMMYMMHHDATQWMGLVAGDEIP